MNVCYHLKQTRKIECFSVASVVSDCQKFLGYADSPRALNLQVHLK